MGAPLPLGTGSFHRLDRRPARARENPWIKAAAARLVDRGLRPNQISLLSVVFSAVAAGSLLLAAASEYPWRTAQYFMSAACIPLRGLCNLCDGLMAVEGGLRTRAGAIYNDLPDRLSDSLLLVAAGYSITGVNWGRDLGWAAGLLSVLTAYVRVLGGSAGASQPFCGPMDKSSRMLVMAGACLAAAGESAWVREPLAMIPALGLIATGCVVTVLRRTRRILLELEGR